MINLKKIFNSLQKTDQKFKSKKDEFLKRLQKIKHIEQVYPNLKLYKNKEIAVQQPQSDLISSLRKSSVNTHFDSASDKTKQELSATVPSSINPAFTLDQDEKHRLHMEIDAKMQEAQDLNLSREEILYGSEKAGMGRPLKDDPVFNTIKNNWDAREYIIGENGDLTFENLIGKCLNVENQIDDANQAGNDVNLMQKNELENDQLQNKIGHFWIENTNTIDAAKHLQQDENMFKDRQEMLKYRDFVTKSINSPDSVRKRFKRQIDRRRFHWKNVEFISEFLTLSGHIKNRQQTRLPQRQQKELKKAVKRARSTQLLPQGPVQPWMKVNLTSQQEMFSKFKRKYIHQDSGALKYKLHTNANDFNVSQNKIKDMFDVINENNENYEWEHRDIGKKDTNEINQNQLDQQDMIKSNKLILMKFKQSKDRNEAISQNHEAYNSVKTAIMKHQNRFGVIKTFFREEALDVDNLFNQQDIDSNKTIENKDSKTQTDEELQLMWKVIQNKRKQLNLSQSNKYLTGYNNQSKYAQVYNDNIDAELEKLEKSNEEMKQDFHKSQTNKYYGNIDKVESSI